MIDLDDDMATVFYGPDFAQAFDRQRAGAASQTVHGIPGREDREALSGRALATHRQLLLPASAGLMRDDTLTATTAIPQWGAAPGDSFKVLDLEHINDGAEVLAHLGKASAP